MRIKSPKNQNILGHESKKSKCVMSQEFWKPTKITDRFFFGWLLGQESWNPKYFVGKESYNPNYFVDHDPWKTTNGWRIFFLLFLHNLTWLRYCLCLWVGFQWGFHQRIWQWTRRPWWDERNHIWWTSGHVQSKDHRLVANSVIHLKKPKKSQINHMF